MSIFVDVNSSKVHEQTNIALIAHRAFERRRAWIVGQDQCEVPAGHPSSPDHLHLLSSSAEHAQTAHAVAIQGGSTLVPDDSIQ
jgi:hypothetical protein